MSALIMMTADAEAALGAYVHMTALEGAPADVEGRSFLGTSVAFVTRQHHVDHGGRSNRLVSATVARLIGIVSDDLQKPCWKPLPAPSAKPSPTTRRCASMARAAVIVRNEDRARPRAANLAFVEMPGFDLAVAIDEAVFETLCRMVSRLSEPFASAVDAAETRRDHIASAIITIMMKAITAVLEMPSPIL
jgi:hypothetical protein